MDLNAVQMFVGLTLQNPGKVFIEVMLNEELKQRYTLNVLTAPSQMVGPK